MDVVGDAKASAGRVTFADAESLRLEARAILAGVSRARSLMLTRSVGLDMIHRQPLTTKVAPWHTG